MDANHNAADRSVGLRSFSWARFVIMMALVGAPCIACACLIVRRPAPDRAQAEPAAARAGTHPLVIVIPHPVVAAQRDGGRDASPTPAPSQATASPAVVAQKPVVRDGFEQSSAPPQVAQPRAAQPSAMPPGDAAQVQAGPKAIVKEAILETTAPLPGAIIQAAANSPPVAGPGDVPSAAVALPTLSSPVIQTAGSNPAVPQLPPVPGPGDVPSVPVAPSPDRPAPTLLPPAVAPSEPAAVKRTDDATGAATGTVLPPPNGTPELPAPGSNAQDDTKPLPPSSPLVLPAPNMLPAGMPANHHPMPSSLWSSPADMPQPTEQELETVRNHVEGLVDPNCILDLVEGRTRLLKLKKPARSVQAVGTKVIRCTPVNGREIAIQATAVGTTVLHLTFDGDDTGGVEVRYLVRVFPALTAREPYAPIFQALEAEIARMFPDSKVQLQLVGEAVIVTGQVREARDATAIMQLVVANTPWANRPAATGPDAVLAAAESSNAHVINRLQIGHVASHAGSHTGSPAGSQVVPHAVPHQVTLKVAVVELSRSALASLFGKGPGAWSDTNHAGAGIVPAVYDVSEGHMAAAWSAAALSISSVKPAAATDGRAVQEPRQILLHGQPAGLVASVQNIVTVSSDKTPGERRSVTLGLQGIGLSFTPVGVDGKSLRVLVAATPSQPGTGRALHTTIAVREGQTLAFTGLIPPVTREQDSQWLGGRRSLLGRLVGVEQPAAPERHMVILLLPEAAGAH